MSKILKDKETGESIINPYITLYNPETFWVALNTQTFLEANKRMIHIANQSEIYNLSEVQGKRVYNVVSSTGKPNSPLELPSTFLRGGLQNREDNIVAVPLGHILEEDVKKFLPESFLYFERERKKITMEF